jgi:hypothetical protein
MNSLKRTTFVAACLLINGSVVWAQTSVSIGVHIGPPPAPRVVYVAPPPPPPQPEYVWVEGYWYPVAHHYMWHDGYWTRPPYPGAHYIAARYEREMFFEGYWQGSRGVVMHDHSWDSDRDRDFPGKGRGRGRGRGHH